MTLNYPSLEVQITLLVNEPLPGYRRDVRGSCSFQDIEAARADFQRRGQVEQKGPLPGVVSLLLEALVCVYFLF